MINNCIKIEPTLFNEKQSGEFLSISHNTLRSGRVTGMVWGVKAPVYIRIGSRIRYRKVDLIEWVAQFDIVSNTSESKMLNH
jgi:hypothetical protein